MAGRPSSRDVVSTAATRAIPVYRAGKLCSAESLHVIRSVDAYCLVSVCYPRLIPADVAAVIPGPSLNVHPSMLPLLRGPDPMFWTFKEGSGESGVTLHELSPRFDAGPVAAQEAHHFSDGTSEADLESKLAELAVKLLATVLEQAGSNSVRYSKQCDVEATYARFPDFDDFRLDRSRPARAAFNFVRGLAGRDVPFLVDLNGQDRELRDVRSYVNNRQPEKTPDGAEWISFADGWLLAELVECER